jgi:hypothetical protein
MAVGCIKNCYKKTWYNLSKLFFRPTEYQIIHPIFLLELSYDYSN